MKKLISSVIACLVLVGSTTVFAATASYKIELKSTKTTVNPGDEISVTLKMKDLQNMTNGIDAMSGKIEFDTDVFEELEGSECLVGSGNWTCTYNAVKNELTNKIERKFLADAKLGTSVKEDNDVFIVKFKVKDTATISNTQIKVTGVEATEGEEDLKTEDAVLDIKVEKKESQPDQTPDQTPDQKPTEKTEKEKANEVAKAFIEAVNKNDLITASKYATEAVIKDVKDYKITELSIKNYENCTYKDNTYTYTADFKSGLGNTSDLKIEKVFTVKKVNGELLVTSVIEKSTTSGDTIPQTGENDIVYISLIGGMIVLSAVSLIGLKKYKNI